MKDGRSLSPGVGSKVKPPPNLDHSMRIGELATAAGISRDTLRFYEQQGLIRSHRLANGYRDYPAEVLLLVNYIRTAQQLGFTLAEIGHRLPALWARAGSSEAGEVIGQVLHEKLTEIDARIQALQSLRDQLATRLAQDCPLAPAQPGAAGESRRIPSPRRRQ